MLEEKIFSDYKEAMKSKDSLKSSVLSFLRAEFKNVAIAQNKNLLEDGDCVAVIKKQLKRREDSIEQFTKGNRPELAEKESREAAILKVYLPPQLSQQELISVIDAAIRDTGASGMKDMGKVIKEVMAKAGPSADSRAISESVKARLSS